ncbi:hypothetical protein B0H94_10879 [Salsuginibacillus halophilus]|uniref:Uncharacterized protein n=1 Tax=Salsuginibacillus halophilus TaxID=517424 RepID=A0A2P8HE07_9BACI|nr:hypothetical protein [Salsuginibacillus halophilus]PSL44468.1 hypothetical protein B0H94_10879 [Salsuginibacillus halophilus]
MKAGRRTVFTFLFTIAIFSTWYSLTGVGLVEVYEGISDTDETPVKEAVSKESGLSEKEQEAIEVMIP